MTGSRIYDGDLVYVKSCSDVENGDIAVVLLNHSEVTIKKILKKEHTVILMATNPVVEPRVFTQEEIEEGQLLSLIHIFFSLCNWSPLVEFLCMTACFSC